mgnify:FL=1
MATCKECGESFSDKRRLLGYETCLECGEQEAQELVSKRKEQIAPAYNKGAYQFITSKTMAFDMGKK